LSAEKWLNLQFKYFQLREEVFTKSLHYLQSDIHLKL